MYLRHIDQTLFWNLNIWKKAQVPKWARDTSSLCTECGCIIGCGHTHQNVATATACVSQPGGYVVAVRRRRYLALTEAEEAEFQRLMFGLPDRKTGECRAGGVLLPAKFEG